MYNTWMHARERLCRTVRTITSPDVDDVDHDAGLPIGVQFNREQFAVTTVSFSVHT